MKQMTFLESLCPVAALPLFVLVHQNFTAWPGECIEKEIYCPMDELGRQE